MVFGCLATGGWWAGSAFSLVAGRFLLALSTAGSSFRLGYVRRKEFGGRKGVWGGRKIGRVKEMVREGGSERAREEGKIMGREEDGESEGDGKGRRK